MSVSKVAVEKHTENAWKNLRNLKNIAFIKFFSFSGQNTFYFIRIDPILLKISAKMQKMAINFLLDFKIIIISSILPEPNIPNRIIMSLEDNKIGKRMKTP